METSEKVPFFEQISYGLGDLASCLYWATISNYLLIFYTDTFGLTAFAAATMMLISRLADPFFDPVIGMISDRTSTKWGKFRPFLLWGCVPLAIAALLTFTVPDFDSKGKLIWAYFTFNAMMLLYTTINIPYSALLGVITSNPLVRTNMSSIKFAGAFLGGIIVNATLLPMSKVGGWLGATSVKAGWQLAFLIYGIIATICFLIVFFTTKERIQPPKEQKTSLARDLGDLLSNKPWLILLATTLTFILFVALRGNVTAHYFKYYVGSQEVTLPSWFFLPKSIQGTHVWDWDTLVSAFGTTNQLLSLLGALLVPFFARITGRKAAFVILLSIAMISTGSFYFLRPNQLLLIFAINALGSITGGPLSALIWVMYADTADYAEWKTGRRATGLIFSASVFAQKEGWGGGSGITGLFLGAIGFVANQAQTASTLHGIVNLMSVIPCVFGMIALILLFFYPLSEKRVREISADLKVRRAKDQAALGTSAA